MSLRIVFCFLLLACSSRGPGAGPAGVPRAVRSVDSPKVRSIPDTSDRLLVPDRRVAVTKLGAEAQTIQDAQDLMGREEWAQALQLLGTRQDAPATYLRAQIYRATDRRDEARGELNRIAQGTFFDPWVALEDTKLLLDEQREPIALERMEALFGVSPAIDRRLSLPLAESRARLAPEELLSARSEHETALDPDDPDARSRLLGLIQSTLSGEPAQQLAMERYLSEPLSEQTPTRPPRPLSFEERLIRAESLLAAHRNERVLEELDRATNVPTSGELKCRSDFAYGLAARKLRRYAQARKALGRVVHGACDSELQRRAHFLWAKVISIASGLAAIKPIEDFAKTYAGHSMQDDVLFWAGDLHQRRGNRAEAKKYYQRVQAITPPGDHCAIARWRTAWMAYRAGELAGAEAGLAAILKNDGCAADPFERARATYWLGRIAEQKGDSERAIQHYTDVTELNPIGFYTQVAMTRVKQLSPTDYSHLRSSLGPPSVDAVAKLCPGGLANDPVFLRGYALYQAGLSQEAAAEWLTVKSKPTEVRSSTHAAALAQEAIPLNLDTQRPARSGCDEDHPGLLLALLLSEVNEKAEAQWRLRTSFASYFARAPTEETEALWLAAYPLEARQFIKSAEDETELPPLFLQALAREESAFDDQIVSWAGAYGLTQLLLSTGQRAGRLLEPKVAVTREAQLLDPKLNARLGGAYLSNLLGRYHGHPALALAAYNAGESVADTWSKRHAGDDLDLFAEEMTIKETRGYVKRVLRTHGIYRWIYLGETPELPAPAKLPTRSR